VERNILSLKQASNVSNKLFGHNEFNEGAKQGKESGRSRSHTESQPIKLKALLGSSRRHI